MLSSIDKKAVIGKQLQLPLLVHLPRIAEDFADAGTA